MPCHNICQRHLDEGWLESHSIPEGSVAVGVRAISYVMNQGNGLWDNVMNCGNPRDPDNPSVLQKNDASLENVSEHFINPWSFHNYSLPRVSDQCNGTELGGVVVYIVGHLALETRVRIPRRKIKKFKLEISATSPCVKARCKWKYTRAKM